MFFKKKNAGSTSRKRLSSTPRRAAVFSYHASRATTDVPKRSGGSGRKLWQRQTTETPTAAVLNPKPRLLRRFRRLPMALIVIAMTGLILNGLALSSSPEVITLADATDRRIFLRDHATYEQIAHEVLDASIFSTNKITIDTQRIETQLRERLPELEHVSVVLPAFGHRPMVYMQPTQPALLLKVADGNIFVLDVTGRALMNAVRNERIEKLELPLIEDQSGLPIALGKVVLPKNDVAFITEVAGQLRAKQIALTSMTLPPGTNELLVGVKDVPYTVKFNLRGDARAAVGSYLAVRQHLEREKKVPSMYIDVRVDNKAYYR